MPMTGGLQKLMSLDVTPLNRFYSLDDYENMQAVLLAGQRKGDPSGNRTIGMRRPLLISEPYIL
jgi:hypothetical protein